MKKSSTTILVDLGVVMALVAIAFGIWFCPWVTLLVLALFLLGGCLTGQKSG